MENKTTISALEELVNQQVKAYIYWCIGYDEEYDKALEHAKEMEEFYSNLGEKLKEVL